MLISTHVVERYEYKDGFYVIIDVDKLNYHCWLGNSNYGVLSELFGGVLDDNYLNTYLDLLDLIEANLDKEIVYYKEDYFDE